MACVLTVVICSCLLWTTVSARIQNGVASFPSDMKSEILHETKPKLTNKKETIDEENLNPNIEVAPYENIQKPLSQRKFSDEPFPTSEPNIDSYKEEIIRKLNEYRTRHENTPKLNFDPNSEITKFSQNYAEYLANNNFPEVPSKHEIYGENLYKGRQSPEVAVDRWYQSGIDYYNFQNGRKTTLTPGISVSNLTQMLWDESQNVGIGVAYGSVNGKWYVVCNFEPRGNTIGPDNYVKHVHPKKIRT